jgi:crotonobetainyl-CoA:carnitine CoA-transferase CaiB-like acyl-CoA transferase
VQKGIFSDIRVLSLEQATVLPYLTYRLVQDGADVIRVENPRIGDPNRLVGAKTLDEEMMNTYFLHINAGKKAITLNLKLDRGQELLKKLIKDLNIDIFATNQLPSNYQKLGIDYEAMRTVKQDLIWLGVTGFGPESNEAAYDPILQARSGLMEVTGESDGPPQVIGIPLSDLGAAEHGYGQVMKALFKRGKTGEGSRIDISMFQSSLSWLTVAITMTATFGQQIRRRGNTHQFFAPVSVYKTVDGYIYIAIGNDRQWRDFIRIPIFETLTRKGYEKNVGRIANYKALNAQIETITKHKTTNEILTMLNQANIPVSRVNTIPDVLREPLASSKLLYTQDPRTGLKVILAPPPIDTPFLQSIGRQLTFPPRLGEHNQEIYGQMLGISDRELTKLKVEGII